MPIENLLLCHYISTVIQYIEIAAEVLNLYAGGIIQVVVIDTIN